jgi:hypothetical protein
MPQTACIQILCVGGLQVSIAAMQFLKLLPLLLVLQSTLSCVPFIVIACILRQIA